MPWFRLFACGEDFPLMFDGQVRPCGFFTTVVVEAETQADAERIAAADIFADEELSSLAEADRKISFERIEEVSAPANEVAKVHIFRMEKAS